MTQYLEHEANEDEVVIGSIRSATSGSANRGSWQPGESQVQRMKLFLERLTITVCWHLE